MGIQSSIFLFLFQARTKWEACGKKGIQHKNLGMKGMEALKTQMSWHPVVSLVQVPPLVLLFCSQIQKNGKCMFFWYWLTQVVLDKGPLNRLLL